MATPEIAPELPAATPRASWRAAPVAENPTSRKGEVIGGRYVIQREIGRGAYGVVFACVDRDRDPHGAPVAVKILSEARLWDEQTVARFKRESAIACALPPHEHLVRCFDYGSDLIDAGGQQVERPYLVMELLPGRTLDQALSAAADGGRRLPLNRSVRIVRQVTTALAVLHERKVTHRDVKPHNVLLTEEDVAKLADLGLALAEEAPRVTQGVVMMTPAYSPPEWLRRGVKQERDPRADVYSLGVTMYETLAGERPYEGGTAAELLDEMARRRPKPVHEINPLVPKEISEIVQQAMAVDRNARYANAQAVLRALVAVTAAPTEEFPIEEDGDAPTDPDETVGMRSEPPWNGGSRDAPPWNDGEQPPLHGGEHIYMGGAAQVRGETADSIARILTPLLGTLGTFLARLGLDTLAGLTYHSIGQNHQRLVLLLDDEGRYHYWRIVLQYNQRRLWMADRRREPDPEVEVWLHEAHAGLRLLAGQTRHNDTHLLAGIAHASIEKWETADRAFQAAVAETTGMARAEKKGGAEARARAQAVRVWCWRSRALLGVAIQDLQERGRDVRGRRAAALEAAREAERLLQLCSPAAQRRLRAWVSHARGAALLARVATADDAERLFREALAARPRGEARALREIEYDLAVALARRQPLAAVAFLRAAVADRADLHTRALTDLRLDGLRRHPDSHAAVGELLYREQYREQYRGQHRAAAA